MVDKKDNTNDTTQDITDQEDQNIEDTTQVDEEIEESTDTAEVEEVEETTEEETELDDDSDNTEDSESNEDDNTEDKPKKDKKQKPAEEEEEETMNSRKDSPTGIKYTTKNNPKALWYVVHTYSGHERKVAITLGERVHVMDLADKINEVLIPTQKKIVISSGKKREIDERLFPGYILVKAEINDNVWHVIRNTPGVTGFVGIGNQPTPLSKKEVNSIVKFIKIDTPKFETKFKEGDVVKITEGAFKDFMGKVSKVMNDQGRLEVLVSVFDRETPVEVDFAQVQSAAA